jgi:hypothetical protein
LRLARLDDERAEISAEHDARGQPVRLRLSMTEVQEDVGIVLRRQQDDVADGRRDSREQVGEPVEVRQAPRVDREPLRWPVGAHRPLLPVPSRIESTQPFAVG